MPAKKKNTPLAEFQVHVVYGFIDKLKIVLLGETNGRLINENMHIRVQISDGVAMGTWKISNIMRMDFINGVDDNNFIGIEVECTDEDHFKLLQSLRVYEETIHIAELKHFNG